MLYRAPTIPHISAKCKGKFSTKCKRKKETLFGSSMRDNTLGNALLSKAEHVILKCDRTLSKANNKCCSKILAKMSTSCFGMESLAS